LRTQEAGADAVSIDGRGDAMVFRAVATGAQYCRRNQISFGQSSFFVPGTHHLALFYLI
jgi:hypothetical protein